MYRRCDSKTQGLRLILENSVLPYNWTVLFRDIFHDLTPILSPPPAPPRLLIINMITPRHKISN